MLNTFKIVFLCQLGLLPVSSNDLHDSGVLLQCDSSCILPEFPRNGRYKVQGVIADTHPGEVVSNSTIIHFHCDVGYVPYSHSTAICIGDVWDTQFTKCQKKVTCPLPTNPVHGSYELLDLGCPLLQGTEVPNWTTVIYSCDSTFEIVGNRTSLCYNGLWTTEPPQCRKTNACTVPDAPAKGTYSILGSQVAPLAGSTIKENQILFYDCPASNILQGGPITVCIKGHWVPEIPSCVGNNHCTLPAVPVNGKINFVNDEDYSLPGIQVPNLFRVDYSCDATFELIGSDNITCYDGSWSTDPPQCLKTTACMIPNPPAKGSYSILGSQDAPVAGSMVKEFQVLKYDCPSPNILQGAPIIYCNNRKWLPEVPTCIRSTYCILPDVPIRGSYSIVGSMEAPVPGAAIAEKEALRYNCRTKNKGPTDHVIVCSNGKWLPRFIECLNPPSDCGDVSGSTSGVYAIQPNSYTEPFDVYCVTLFDELKWTVIQQRFTADVDFYRSYAEYSEGFGAKTGNHWLGLEHIHEITKGGHHELYVELEAHNGTKAYARYDTFSVGNSSTGFQLTISGYSGTAGDSMTEQNLDGMKFTTFDKDQDKWSVNCAEYMQGAWWYNWCSNSNLNGQYHNTAVDSRKTMNWGYHFGGYALKTARMMIRRK